jgi:hypothetical protein
MGVPGQNALLKILEEPPPYGVFLLLTDNPEKLLPTVRSRCTELNLLPLQENILRQQLEREFPRDHIPSVDGYTSVKMHTHLFRYFSGRPGAAALRARLNSVRTFAEIYDIIRQYGTGRKSSG